MKKELFNIALVGESKVGKSCLLSRYLNGQFPDAYKPTLPGDFQDKEIVDKDGEYTLRFWDVGAIKGLERTLRHSSVLIGVDVAFVVFSLENVRSFEEVNMIVDIIQEKCHGHCNIILVGNKTDLGRYVSQMACTAKASVLGLQYIETSAKDEFNVNKMFQLALDCCKKKLEERANMEVFHLPGVKAPEAIEERNAKSSCSMM